MCLLESPKSNPHLIPEYPEGPTAGPWNWEGLRLAEVESFLQKPPSLAKTPRWGGDPELPQKGSVHP